MRQTNWLYPLIDSLHISLRPEFTMSLIRISHLVRLNLRFAFSADWMLKSNRTANLFRCHRRLCKLFVRKNGGKSILHFKLYIFALMGNWKDAIGKHVVMVCNGCCALSQRKVFKNIRRFLSRVILMCFLSVYGDDTINEINFVFKSHLQFPFAARDFFFRLISHLKTNTNL